VRSIPPSRPCLSLNTGVNDVFPDFSLGSFAVLYGSTAVLPLSMLLCVRAQLPYQLGGLRTNVLFIDGNNTFRLYDVSHIAQLHELDPRKVLKRIFISRAFTAHQMTALVFERLQTDIENFDSKLIIISDIAKLYLDEDIPQKEARDVFRQLTEYLSKFARENHVVIVATYLSSCSSERNVLLRAIVFEHANIVVPVKPSKKRSNRMNKQYSVQEKHSLLSLRSNFLSHTSGHVHPLTEFMEA
jgi:hypothetical protein